MKLLVELPAPGLLIDAGRFSLFAVSCIQHIAVPLLPRCVGDFRHNGLHLGICLVIHIVKTHRIEAVTEVTQVSEQTDGAGGTDTRVLHDCIADGIGQ